MIKRKTVFFLFLFPFVLFFNACGIEEYYFLPQVSESAISLGLNTNAAVNLPSISNEYYFASGYVIFYRIYISNILTDSSTDINQISSILVQDYNYFSQFTNPANTSSIISSNTFRNRNYFELEFEGVEISEILPKTGGVFQMRFPTVPWDYPVASINNEQEIQLRRSGKLISPEPMNDPFFRNTLELRLFEYANSNINADVSGRSAEGQYAYVSMYIAAAGANPSNFTSIYSKPTHIGVFKLPDTN